MTRRHAWILNLDAELELARNRPGYVPQRKLLAQLAEHGQSAHRLLGPRDVLLADLAEPSGGVVGRTWCPTPLAIAELRARGVEPEAYPEANVLRRVNHRLFAHEIGLGLPEQAYLGNRAELEQKLAQQSWSWLLKRPLSFAGRGQLRAIGPLTDKQWTWVDASFARDGLLVEPLVEPTLELSLHGFMRRDGQHRLGRICVQQVSERGAFRGVQLAEPGALRGAEVQALEHAAERVAAALVAAGYFGPFGIDAYRYRWQGRDAFCALGELNARYTLSFVTGFPVHPSELEL